MTKHNRAASPRASESSKSTVKVSAGLVSSAASLLGCVLPVFRWPSLCVCVLISTSEDTNHNGLGPSRMTPLSLHHLLQGLISKYSYILRYWDLSIWIWSGHNSAITTPKVVLHPRYVLPVSTHSVPSYYKRPKSVFNYVRQGWPKSCLREIHTATEL